MHLAGFAPAFTLSLCDSEAPANRQMPIASVVRQHGRKRKKRPCKCYKIFDELTASVTSSHEFETTQIVQFSTFDLRTIPRRFFGKKDRIAIYHFDHTELRLKTVEMRLCG